MLKRWRILPDTKKKLVGLDLGTDSLKLIEINSSTTPKRVEKVAIGFLPPQTIEKNEIKDYQLVTNILQTTLEEANIQTKNVAIAIPRSSTIIKNINIDSRLGEEEIESRARIEANHHFPGLVEESYLDFSIVGPSPQDPKQLELMLVACRKEIIKPYFDILNKANLNLKIVDVNSFALERALYLISSTDTDLETIALLNLDISLSTLIVTQQEKLIYAHDEAFNGSKLQSQLKEVTGDEIKLESVLKENLTAYLRHVMHFFYSSRPNINIKKMYLSGDCAMDPLLLPFIQKEIGIEVELANPFLTMELNPTINDVEIQKFSPALMLSTGLALSTID